MIRVLITASRTWDRADLVDAELDLVAADARTNRLAVTVVHGGAAGGDRIAGAWARGRAADGWPVREEVHPADWEGPCTPRCTVGHRQGRSGSLDTYCPAAGMYRNAAMVALGAFLLLAFLDPCAKPRCRKPQPHDSHGADECLQLAEQAGIRTHITRRTT